MPSSRITEVKTTLAGEQKRFECELLRQTENETVIVYRMPRDRWLENILLRKNTLSLGYFWEDRPYNAYHWIDARGGTVALYFNISDHTRIGKQTIEWRDLAVDILISPDGRCRILDEDELPPDLDRGLLDFIHAARDELCRKPLSRLGEYDKLTRSLMNLR